MAKVWLIRGYRGGIKKAVLEAVTEVQATNMVYTLMETAPNIDRITLDKVDVSDEVLSSKRARIMGVFYEGLRTGEPFESAVEKAKAIAVEPLIKEPPEEEKENTKSRIVWKDV